MLEKMIFKEKIVVKFTNCCYFRGGGKVPYRVRKFQNCHFYLLKDRVDQYTDQELINHLPSISKNKYRPMSTTKVIRPHTS